MTTASLDILRTKIAALQTCRPLGRVRQIGDGRLLITGLNQSASLGEEIICRAHQGALRAEIISLSPEGVEAMPYGCADGLRLNAEVEIAGPPTIAPDDTWIGRIVDPFGLPLDGRPLRSGQSRPIRGVPPSAGMRHGFGERLATGYATMDTLLPIAEGQRIGIFAGSGVGKSRLLGDLAREMDADIVVAALIGERGREVASFARDTMGPAGMARATVIAATSDRPANVRRRALPAALAVAERFREQGARVLFVCDSLTRHAEAYRDVMGGGKDSDLPPGLVADLAACVERAGPGSGRDRAITAIFSVLVAGSDMEEPVADAVRGLLDGHIVLSREIAEAGRFPAIDPLASVSRSLPDVATKAENEIISRTRRILETFSRNELMITSGLYEQGRDPEIDEAIRKRTSIEAVFTQTTAGPSESFSLLQTALQ